MGRHRSRSDSRGRSRMLTDTRDKNRSVQGVSKSIDRYGRNTDKRSDSRSRNRQRSRDRSRDKKKTKKKKKRRTRSSSSDVATDTDSISSNDSAVMVAKIELKKLNEKERWKQEKARRKAMETPEEKRARRLMKKQIKSLRRKQTEGWSEQISQYDNDDNPFGDSTLTQPFRWEKKLEKEGLGDLKDEELDQLAQTRIMEQKMELEKVKKARLEREREKQERLELEELENRQKETDKFSKWAKDEDQFHLKQALLRSSIRISDGRAKPIDLLAKYISAEGEVDTVEMHEPYTYLNGLSITDLEDLLEDILVYQRLEKGNNCEYWEDITIIVKDELHKLRKLDSRTGSQYEAAIERREGINKAVQNDVQHIFKGKTVEQLEQLQKQIEVKLQDRTEGVDIGYWESLISQLKAHTARGRLRDRHQQLLRSKLAQLKAEQLGKKVEDVKPGPSRIQEEDKKESTAEEEEEDEEDEEGIEYEDGESEVKGSITEYNRGCYSPDYARLEDLPPGTVTFLEEEDVARRNFDQVKAQQGAKVENVLTGEERALEREAKKGMGEDEAVFSVESTLDQSYEWSDKYRPRKPRYFNRVHTGFEWNKYNQTHYDFDNPPPKIVQGYKFNIFYPDLIDKSITPEFRLIPTDDGDFCILKVTSGPPYEDIAFKIVNREWEYGYKRGFRCQFHNNIFQLWFHFKRYRYRR
ncbi:cactin-like isoform X2 [Eurytemora carolleeae]|uniref:cactin-like isoform X2 n=1 Tax=Eurytemora carolleeae TaxID=1294199 RepID=UPI000C7935EE|nr:cactin-like isoform X2 [Eurytemora carolleeae]|eukprot:XP_023336077.1 cactin-like isoform X2 [Eurytemora affinis]